MPGKYPNQHRLGRVSRRATETVDDGSTTRTTDTSRTRKQKPRGQGRCSIAIRLLSGHTSCLPMANGSWKTRRQEGYCGGNQTDRTRVVAYLRGLIVSYLTGYYVLTFHVFRQSVYMYVKMYVYLVKANLETIRVFRDSYIMKCV